MPLRNRIRRPGTMVVISLLYFFSVSGIMIWRGISVSPDYILLLLVPVGILSGRFLGYLRDWVPFIVIFLGWEAMRGLVTKLGIPPHVAGVANIEKSIFFGHVMDQVLQSLITGRAQQVVALCCTVVYFCHFIVPLGVGMVLWLVDRTQFLRFTATLMGMSFFCFFIFLLVPTAPPWYADSHGAITGVHNLISQSLPSAISPYYQSLDPNPFAAFPSLHTAYPFLCFLALRRTYPRAAYVALVWTVLVMFSVMFLGQHYGIDVIGGLVTAAVSWQVMMRVLVPRIKALQETPVPAPKGTVTAPA